MLERVEFRAALTPADREAAYRLRYQAYLRQNLLGPRVDAMLHDEIYDKSDNALTTLTFIDGELASTVRVHVVTNDAAASPTCDVFPDVLAPRIFACAASSSTRRASRPRPKCRASFRNWPCLRFARRGWRRSISTLTSWS